MRWDYNKEDDMQAKGHVFKYGDNIDTDVIIPASVTEIDKEAFTSAWKPSCSAVIHAPAGSYAEHYAKEKNIQFAVQTDQTDKCGDHQEDQAKLK